ncbi:MAG: alpha/beta hydrolase [Sandaracinaceae bacterium]|nr:alpha/beta hydrolase [Sandaracinaceae bacterium]
MEPTESPPSALQTLPRNRETSAFEHAPNQRAAVAPDSWTHRARAAVRNVARPLFVPEQWIRWQMRRAKLSAELLTVPEGQLHVWVGPPGKPALLLLHGFGSDAAWQWHPQVVALSRHFRLFVPDLLYFGKSLGHGDDFSLECQVRACLQLLDRYGVERAHAVGISFGGLVACEMASSHPERVERVVLSNSSGPEYLHVDHQATLEHFGVSDMNQLLLPERPEDIRRLLAVAWHKPPPVPGFALEEAYQSMFTTHREAQAETMRQLVGRIESPEWEGRVIDKDTLLLWGEHDRVFTVPVAKRLRARVGSRARLHVIANAAHSPNQERGAEYNRVLLRFLRGQPMLAERRRFRIRRARTARVAA